MTTNKIWQIREQLTGKCDDSVTELLTELDQTETGVACSLKNDLTELRELDLDTIIVQTLFRELK